MKLEVLAAGTVFYPDAMVSCDEAEGQPRQLWLASVGLGLLDADAFGDLDTAVSETRQ